MPRPRSLLLIFAAIFASSLAVSCAQKPAEAPAMPDTRAADEATIRTNDADWAKAAEAKDFDKCISYYSDDAVAFAPGLPAVIGKDNVRKFIQGLVASPSLQLAIHVASVTVARSGDIAIDRGTVDATITNAKGKATGGTSAYVLVWEKQPDGSWKILADTSANEPK
jgi:uncharacterized protein (TIGR02246 family)